MDKFGKIDSGGGKWSAAPKRLRKEAKAADLRERYGPSRGKASADAKKIVPLRRKLCAVVRFLL